MKRGSSALLTLTLLILFCASTLVSGALPDKPPRVPKPPGIKGKGIGKIGKGVLKKKGRGRGGSKSSKSKKQYDKQKKEEESRYHVVQIGLKFEVVQKKNLASLKKSAPKKYKAQMSAYEKAQRKGRGSKAPRPPSTVFKVLTDKGYKTQKEAQADAQRLQRKAGSKRKR